MTLLLTSGSNHTIPPRRRGGANQKDHRPHSTGGGDEAKQKQTGKATRPNKTTTHMTGKAGYHEVGGEGGWQPCIIYTYMHICTQHRQPSFSRLYKHWAEESDGIATPAWLWLLAARVLAC